MEKDFQSLESTGITYKTEKPEIILSLFQWSYGGFIGPRLVIFENGLIIRLVYEHTGPKLKSTTISSEKLNEIIKEISDKINLEETKKIYDLSQGVTDQPTIDIMCNFLSKKYIRIKGCRLNDKKITYNKNRNKLFKRVYPKQDKIPQKIKKLLSFLNKYEYPDFRETIPTWFTEELIFNSLVYPYR